MWGTPDVLLTEGQHGLQLVTESPEPAAAFGAEDWRGRWRCNLLELKILASLPAASMSPLVSLE
jgi:hypothetical protein